MGPELATIRVQQQGELSVSVSSETVEDNSRGQFKTYHTV